jgi:hypothetical protein
MRANPDNGAEFASALVNDEAGPLVDVERVRDLSHTTFEPKASPPPIMGTSADPERNGLCVVCQDEEATIAIVDCGPNLSHPYRHGGAPSTRIQTITLYHQP